jgi:hypothetical protein
MHDLNGLFGMTISHLVRGAASPTRAIQLAEMEMNTISIHMQQIHLLDEMGEEKALLIDRVEYMQWHHAEFTEISNQFRVIGNLNLLIKYKSDPRRFEDIRKKDLTFKRSALSDQPVLMIPSMTHQYYVKVLKHSIKWDTFVQQRQAVLHHVS